MVRQMSPKYSFEPLELAPFTRIDVAGLVIEDTEPPQPQAGAASLQSAFDDDIKQCSSTFGSSTTYDLASYAPANDSAERKLFAQNEYLRTSLLQRKSRKYGPLWVTAVLAAFTSTFSIYYSYRVLVDEVALPSSLQLQPGTTVLVINILSHVVAFLCWTLFSDTMEALRWALACRPEGILLTSFLVLSRATPFLGVAYLCTTKGPHQFWAMQRILAFVSIIVLGLVLITNVTYKNIYTPYSYGIDTTNATQNVVAGLVPPSSFGVSIVGQPVINLLASSYSMGFITDPRFATSIEPVTCSGKDCVSIFLPGGIDIVRYDDSTDAISLFSGDFSGDYTTIVVNNAPGYQVEFTSVKSADSEFQFDPNVDCKLYLQSIGDGLYICMVEKDYQLFLGWTVCPTITQLLNQCQTDLSWTETITWNTTVAIFSRKATVAYDSQNISILSIESITAPIPTAVDILDFKLYCDLVLAPVPATLNISANESSYETSCTGYNVGFGLSFLLRLYATNYTTYSDGGLSLLRGFFAVPFQFSTTIQLVTEISNFPKENHVTASLSKISYRAIIQPWTVYVFGILAALVTSWGIGCLIWVSFYGPNSPNTSFFPEIDITSKSSMHTICRKSYSDSDQKLEMADETLEDLGKLTRINGLGNGMSRSVVKAICGKRVFCGSCPGSENGERVIVLVTEHGQVKLLNQHESYA